MSTKKIISDAIMDYRYTSPLTIDKRRTSIKKALKIGFTPEKIIKARETYFKRRRVKFNDVDTLSFELKILFLKRIKEAEFLLEANSSRFNCTGIDWTAYHRPSSNGKGWVLIAPDEPSNNWYIDDKNIVKILSKKYLN